MIKRIKQYGIGLLELMLALAIIALLLVMATRYYGSVRFHQKTNQALKTVQAIVIAGNRWQGIYNSFDHISMDNLIKRDFINGNLALNPWGGEIAVEPYQQQGGGITVTMVNIPERACLNLREKLWDQEIDHKDNCPAAGNNGSQLVTYQARFLGTKDKE